MVLQYAVDAPKQITTEELKEITSEFDSDSLIASRIYKTKDQM